MQSSQNLQDELDRCLRLCVDSDNQRKLLQTTIHHPQCLKYPPSIRYRKMFLKLIIAKLEESEMDIADELYEAFTDVISIPSEEQYCYKTYTLPSGDMVTLEESVSLVSQGTTGLQTWQAAMHLAEFLLENGKLIYNRSVIELGCGLGFTGIIACRSLQPTSYVFTDCHQEVLKRLKKNLQINELFCDDELSKEKEERNICDHCDSLEVNNLRTDKKCVAQCHGANVADVVQLDWNDLCEDVLKDRLRCDVVLAADVIYDPSIIANLLNILSILLSDGAVAYLASTIRNVGTYDAFLSAMDAANLNHEVIKGPDKEAFFYDRTSRNEILRISAIRQDFLQ
ncbi:protein-lysine N-methyltransferase EEF2KMT-like [Lineus longissimus]|uniref:protein-lysine N-methyltransferase EEF2KMT-like n=1 Tax=Lineus longissimus TaxID=88925 RepID=UPI00315D81D7